MQLGPAPDAARFAPMYQLLKSRTLALAAISLAGALALSIGIRGPVAFWAYLACSLPLAVNLAFCLYDHLATGKTRGAAGWSFWLSHLALLLVIAGGLASYATRTEGYVRLVEGESVPDTPAGYDTWRERYLLRPASGLELTLQEVTVSYWPDGKLKDYANLIMVRPPNGAPFPALLRVNGPLEHRWLTVSVTRNHGLAVLFAFTDHRGTASDAIYLRPGREERFAIPGTGLMGAIGIRDAEASVLSLVLHENGQMVRDTEIGAGSALALETGLLQVVEIRPWSELAVVYDPWRYLVYSGFLLFLASTLVYYWKRRNQS